MNSWLSALLGDGTDFAPPAPPEALASLLPWRVFDPARDLFINHGSYGFVLEAPGLVGLDEESANVLAGAFCDGVPANCIVQIIHWASPACGGIIEHWARSRMMTGGMQKDIAAARRSYLLGGVWGSLFAERPVVLRDYRLFIAVSLPGKPSVQGEEGLRALRRGIEGALTSLGAPVRALDPQGFLSVASEWIAPDPQSAERPERRWAVDEPLHLQLADPEAALRVCQGRLRFASGVDVRVLSAMSLPEAWPVWRGTMLLGDFFREHQQHRSPVLTCLTLAFGNEAQGEMAILKSARATQQAGTGLARFVPGLAEKAREWRQVAEQVKNGARIVRAHYAAAVYARAEDGEEALQAARTLYQAHGWRMGAENFVQLQTWLSCLPMVPACGLIGDMQRLGRLRTLVSDTAVHLAPWHGEWRGLSGHGQRAPALILAGRRGQIASWTPFANSAGNYNVAVSGKSGSGKSVLMQELAAGLVGAGGQVVVIDDGRSFKHVCEALDGDFVEFGNVPISLNPFSMIDPKAVARDADYREDALGMLNQMVRRMCRHVSGVSEIEAALIDEAVSAAWKEHEARGEIAHVRDHLAALPDNRAKDLARMLGPYAGEGLWSRLFKGRCTLAIDSPMVVFELAEIKGRKEVQGLVLMLLVFLATQKMYGDRTRMTSLIIDEAWDLLAGSESGAFVEGVARRARKYNGNLVTGTQSVNDYHAAPAARAAWDNSDWTIFLAQKPESIALLREEKRIACDDGMERALKSLRTVGGAYSELLLHGPEGWSVLRLLLDPLSSALYSTKGEEWAAVERALKGGKGSIRKALGQHVKAGAA